MKYTILTLGNPERVTLRANIHLNMDKHFEYVPIEGVDGKTDDLREAIERHQLKINFDRWKPGEGGVWFSNINAWSWGEEHNEDLLVFEDDAILSPDFSDTVNELELPDDWDFVTLYYPYYGSRQIMQFKIAPIHQEHGNVAVLYSAQGMKKIMQMLRDEGLDWPVDIWLFKKAKFEKTLNGYGAHQFSKHIVEHDFDVPTNIHEDDHIPVHHIGEK